MRKHFPRIYAKDVKPSLSLFLITAVVFSYYFSLLSPYILQYDNETRTFPTYSIQNIVTHVLLLSVWIIYFFTDKLWKSAYAVFLLIALSPFFELTNQGFSFSIGSLTIDLIAFFFLLLHLLLNPDVLRDFSKLLNGSGTKQTTLNPKTLEKLEKKFETKPEEQLQYISTSADYSDEAQIAAKNLLKKRSAQ